MRKALSDEKRSHDKRLHELTAQLLEANHRLGAAKKVSIMISPIHRTTDYGATMIGCGETRLPNGDAKQQTWCLLRRQCRLLQVCCLIISV